MQMQATKQQTMLEHAEELQAIVKTIEAMDEGVGLTYLLGCYQHH